MSRAVGFGGARTTPCGLLQIPAAHNPCTFWDELERRVSIPRKYAGISVIGFYSVPLRPFLDVHRGFVWPYLCFLLASVCSYFIRVVVYFIFERLGVDSYLQTQQFQFRHSMMLLHPMMVLKAFWGYLEVNVGALGGVLEAVWVVLGPLWQPQIDQEVRLRALDGFC